MTLLTFAGCGNSPHTPTLHHAESIMEEHPDSALALLRAIDGSKLRGEDQALHALLLSQAYDKNDFIQTSDSLISIAVSYYERTDDIRHKMLSFYYKAVANFQCEDLDSSLSLALKAHDIATKLDDTVNLTRIEGLIGTIYSCSYSLKPAYEWELRALEHAKTTGNKQWLSSIYYNIGDNLLYLQRFKESIAYLDSAAMLCEGPNIEILEDQYLSYFHQKLYTEADSIYTEIISHGFEPPLNVIIGNIERHPQNSIEILDRYAKDNQLTMENMDADLAYTMAYLRTGDIEPAIQALKRHILHYNELFSALNTYKLDHVQHKHDLEVAQEHSERASSYRALALISMLILCLFIIIGFLIYIQYHNQRKTRIIQAERNLLLLENEYNAIKSSLEHSESEIRRKQTRIQNLEEELYGIYAKNDEQTISNLNAQIEILRHLSYQFFLKQFSWIEKMGQMYLGANKSPLDKEKSLYDKVSDELKHLSSRNGFLKKLPALIAQHDVTFSQEIDSLRLIKSEREVLLCILCGLSPAIIAILTNKTQRAIYNIKARLKDKLRRNDSTFANHILKTID